MMQAVRVLVIGSTGRRTESLLVLLRAIPGVEKVGHAECASGVWQTIGEFCPDVVLVDVGMPEPQIVALLRRLAAAHPEIGRLALVGTRDQALVAHTAGATAVVMVPATLERLQAGIRDASQRSPVAT
jgi:DNA-binding NarL/FixJ family response regulator